MPNPTALVFKYWDALRANYWFVPALMCTCAAVAAMGFGVLDQWLNSITDSHALASLPWLHVNDANGARSVLSTIAGSMITVAGVVFSITIAAVAYTASQFGPRLLSNFMRDRGNQITLGTFTATFVYCLLVLRTVQGQANENSAYIPHISILFALLLALASLAVLIYFIHHVPESIHIANLVAGIGRELNSMIDDQFAPSDHDRPAKILPPPNPDPAEVVSVVSKSDGYIQNLVDATLVSIATEHDIVVRRERRIGEFVHARQLTVSAWPAANIDDNTLRRLRQAFALGRQRTPSQDPIFLVNELVEMAARALSPGINDPFTAMACMDLLRSALAELATCNLPLKTVDDADGYTRLIRPPVDFALFADAIFDQLRPYFAADPNAARHMLTAMNELVISLPDTSQCEVIRRHARALYRAARESDQDKRSRELLEAAAGWMESTAAQ